MDYVSNSGWSAGPIQIPESKLDISGSTGTWITHYNGALYFTNTKNISLEEGERIHTYRVLRAGRPSGNEASEVATVGYVKDIVSGGSGTETDFSDIQDQIDSLKYILYKKIDDLPLYDASKGLISRVEDLENSDNIFRERVEAIEEDIVSIRENIVSVEANIVSIEEDIDIINNYMEDPFPQGVIFIAGGA